MGFGFTLHTPARAFQVKNLKIFQPFPFIFSTKSSSFVINWSFLWYVFYFWLVWEDSRMFWKVLADDFWALSLVFASIEPCQWAGSLMFVIGKRYACEEKGSDPESFARLRSANRISDPDPKLDFCSQTEFFTFITMLIYEENSTNCQEVYIL